MKRRQFLEAVGVATGVAAIGRPGYCQEPGGLTDRPRPRNERPDIMPYRKLGRTNFVSSRLIFGCGAALAGGRGARLLDLAFEAGINYFDVGSNDYYKGAENTLAPFMKRHRDQIWVTSKGYARTGEELTVDQEPTVEQAKRAANFWSGLVDQSLIDLDTDFIDAYFTQGAHNAAMVKNDEMGRAFEKVKADGKVGHVGVSTHQNAAAVLHAAVATGWYDLAMIAVTPAGWYDWKNKTMLAGTPPLTTLRPQLDAARRAGLGIIGMKVARFIAAKTAGGAGTPETYDGLYPAKLMESGLNAWQRSYSFVLENGVDAVNSDMQNVKHFEENLIAARTSETYFA